MHEFPLLAGSAVADITPRGSIFLAGYPNVPRYSTGVHDPLLSSALCLQSGPTRVLIIANDVIYVGKDLVARARQRISATTGVPPANILISATHTHSGPKMLDPIATSGDEAVPKTDASYVAFVEEGIVNAAVRAAAELVPAEIGFAVADAPGIGTNRRDPAGASDSSLPLLLVRRIETDTPIKGAPIKGDRYLYLPEAEIPGKGDRYLYLPRAISAMLICSMHPTVLHEDSTLVSGDFPGLARLDLQREPLGEGVPVLYHTGPAGNQSPRHVTMANTFAEAERLGRILSDAVKKVIPSIEFQREIALDVQSSTVSLPLRKFIDEAAAKSKLDHAVNRLQRLRDHGAPRTEIRTAEVDFFGAQETLTLVRASASGEIQAAADHVLPAEIQLLRIGPWNFVAWPGEMFVEFALEVKRQSPDTFIISYANGELQGYLVTRQAADEGGYESSNAIFKSPESGEMLVAKTLELLKERMIERQGSLS